ncbi:efflux RND transporter permease subunit [Intestinibacter bartlettii]|uniref:Efflux RND transporter permease subunit n=1 Tax=Intestinibacter bartlettii TaxID=261299 RepID=A0ABS8CY55_9FIRM|nr:efflux RND transporter permease subunit [Intestinibacter bartlettii]MCB5396986.1 efflux RND transporter permease subunit [Intestinibacter bartlettii]MCB5403535.1 efflux RND transporter permease subunit [Intestinibacter bartlettii]MCB5445792.1 efflux RND transporter permease subunit [Intestinibacter bartlettii]MCB5749814.1 efflux RND transporter permease subunit [Intestinibacter bartlettii]
MKFLLPKFSVKKPLTVFVAMILVLVLGVVSFTKMTTDLLPSMNLPYVIAYTPYPGASPEKVENTVTNPLEEVFSTVSGVENVTSISNENVSMVVLEFSQDTNMDSAMIDLNGQVDLVKSKFDDTVGSTTLMKLNPDMMPIMMVSVDMDGMSQEEISTYVNDEIIPSLERIEGVASVSATGLVESQLQITLDTDKIDSLNKKIKANIHSELDKNEKKIDDGISKLNKSEKELDKKSQEQISKLSEASVELESGLSQLSSAITQIQMMDSVGDSLNPTISDAKKALNDSESKLKDFKNKLKIAEQNGLDTSILKENIASLESTIKTIKISIENAEKGLNSSSASLGQLQAQQKELKSQKKQLETAKSTLNQELTKASIKIIQGKAQLESAKQELNKSREEALKSADLSSKITPDMINSVLTAENFSMPAGYVSDDAKQYSVKVGDKFTSIDQVEDLLLMSIDGIGDIYLKDIADIKYENNVSKSYTNVNGNPGIMLSIEKTSTSSTSSVCDKLNQTIDSLTDGNDKLHILSLMDQGIYIDMVINSILDNLLYGGILAIIVLLVFLRSIKPTVIIAFSIPMSLLFAVVLMYFTDISLNMISLSGLSLGVGMLVDNSIVVIENIYRMRNNGVSRYKAAVYGAKQVSGAIFASTLTTICVFLPIVFTDGITKQIFTDMGLTIAYSLIASLIIALTLVPCMASKLLTSADEKEHRWFDKFVDFYETLLEKALNHKSIVLIGALILLCFAGFSTTRMGTAFMPDMSSTQMTATISPKEGQELTNDDLQKISDDFVKIVGKIDDVEGVGAMNGSGTMMGMSSSSSSNSMSVYIVLKEDMKHSNKEIAKMIKDDTSSLNCDISVNESTMDMGSMVGSGISIQIKGDDLDKLQDISNDMVDILKNTDGAIDIKSSLDNSEVEQRVSVNKDEAMKYGLTVAQVYQQISEKLKSETTSTTITSNSNDLAVVIKNNASETTIKDLKLLEIKGTKNNKDAKVKLNKIATITNATTPASINHKNQTRYMTVSASVDEDHNIGLISRDIQSKIDDYNTPNGYEVELTGENETINSTMKDLVLMILLAIVFIYLIMVAQFQSLLSPFIVMFTIPLAFTGGLLGLLVTRQILSVTSMLGFLILAGIVVNNGIVFVDYVNQLRLDGVDKRTALLETGRARIRPILMTAMTTILAMSTMALGVGMGSELSQGLSIVTIGGLLYATLLTLFIVPILYDIFHRKEMKKIIIDDED